MPARQTPGYPPGFENQINVLYNQVCTFSANWRLYQDLFSSDENRKIVNDTAPGAFMLIEHALRNDMVMAIGRLTDPPKTGKKENLSLEYLIQELQHHCPTDLHDQLKADLKQVRDHIEPFKELRNRMVGHIDKPTALETSSPLLGISRPQVEETMNMLDRIMNRIIGHFTGAVTRFKHVEMHGNGEHLVFYLKAALDHFAEKKRKAFAGLPSE